MDWINLDSGVTNLLDHYSFIGMMSLEKYNKSIENRLNLYSTMQHAVQLFSDLGRNVIVDTVYLDGGYDTAILVEFACLLKNHPVLFLKVDCELQELEKRELQRGDRDIGEAKYQSEHLQKDCRYDAVIDTTKNELIECMQHIISMLCQKNGWGAFGELANGNI